MVKFIVLYLNTNLSGFSPSLFKKAKKLSSFFFPNNGKFQLVLHLNTVQAFPGKWSESVTLLSFAFCMYYFYCCFDCIKAFFWHHLLHKRGQTRSLMWCLSLRGYVIPRPSEFGNHSFKKRLNLNKDRQFLQCVVLLCSGMSIQEHRMTLSLPFGSRERQLPSTALRQPLGAPHLLCCHSLSLQIPALS